MAFGETRSITPTVPAESLKMRNVSAVGCMIFKKRKASLKVMDIITFVNTSRVLLIWFSQSSEDVKERIKYRLGFFFFFYLPRNIVPANLKKNFPSYVIVFSQKPELVL